MKSSENDNNLLSVQNLKVYFMGDERVSKALEGISYDVKRAETVCLVGESGCGKTVSALTIMGLLPHPPGQVMGGRILFNGKDLLGKREEEMREVRGKEIAMVFQEPMTSLNPVFSIGYQIREAIAVHEVLPEYEINKRCLALLDDVGMPSPKERMSAFPHQMSGGQRQRVMIAMALACGPGLIIADEPTTALDVTIQAQILNLFEDLRNTRSMSLLYITHDLSVVANIADRVYVMYAGVIAEQGVVSDIFDRPAHPYTMGLLESLPSRDKRGNPLTSIQGTVPDPAFKPSGCPFHPRCPYAVDPCRIQFPQMCDYGDDHLSRCPVLYERQGKGGCW